MVVIKWTNNFSGETGFVESVNTKEQHFVNTYDIQNAKQYKAEANAKGMISKLISYGEGDNNTFEIVEVWYMLKTLRVSNKKITIDDIEILKYLKKFNYIKLNELNIYEIPEVFYCGAKGRLTVYLQQGNIFKLSFLVVNACNIFGISSNFDAYNTFLAEMEENYRQQSNNVYYNKRYTFKILKNDNNFMVIIRGR